jgi:hypothetical protein
MGRQGTAFGLVVGCTAILAGALPAMSASVVRQTAIDGGRKATLTFIRHPGSYPEYSDLHLTVLDGSRLLIDEPVTSSEAGVGGQVQPGGFSGRSSLSFRDLNGDGSKELLLALFTGGAHCCSVEQVFDFSGARSRKTEFGFGDSGANVKVLDRRVVFMARDASFDYQFTDYADSGAPVVIWAYDAGLFSNVTLNYPTAISQDAAFWWKLCRGRLAQKGDVRGILSAWAADEAMLGQAAHAKELLLHIAFDGALDYGFDRAKGSRYVRALWRFLAKDGYLR